MSPFFWRAVLVLGILLLAFVIATIVITLLFVNELNESGCDIDDVKLTFIQAANWIYVGLMAFATVGFIIGTPYFVAYTRRSESIVSTGLRKARPFEPAEKSKTE